MKKRLLSLVLGTSMITAMLAGCGSTSAATTASSAAASEASSAAATSSAAASTAASTTASTGSGKVYYLNFKPEQDEQWQALAKKYTEETGVPVTVVTALPGDVITSPAGPDRLLHS